MDVIIQRNKVMFILTLVLDLLMVISNVASNKPLNFTLLVFGVLTGLLIVNFFCIYKSKINPFVPGYIFLFVVYGLMLIVITLDPSMNKFLFLFAVVSMNAIYQNNYMMIVNGFFAVSFVAYSYFMFGEQIFGGYDVIEIKHFIFPVTVIIFMIIIMTFQASTSEKQRKSAIENEKTAIKQTKITEEILSRVQKSSEAMKKFSSELKNNTNDIQESTNSIVNKSFNMNSSFSNQDDNTSQIVKNMVETKKELDVINDLSNSMKEKSDLSEELLFKSEENILELNDSFNMLKETLHRTFQNSEKLDIKTKEIVNIIEIINAITKRTQLLAFNASIEAARAGEAGHGFSIIADEIRSLADNSFSSTKDIIEILNEIQEKTINNKELIMDSNKAAEISEQNAISVKEAFEKLKENNEITNNEIDSITKKIPQLKEFLNVVNHLSVDTENVSKENIKHLSELNEELKIISDKINRISSEFDKLNEATNE